MIERFRIAPVASTLERSRISGQEVRPMARGWCRSSERRRGVAALLSAVASALPGSREPKVLRQRFESELRDLLNAREVELRDGVAVPRPAEGGIWLDVDCGEYTLGAIDATFDPGACPVDEWDHGLIESARRSAPLVRLFER